jgi:hypothetical protein
MAEQWRWFEESGLRPQDLLVREFSTLAEGRRSWVYWMAR